MNTTDTRPEINLALDVRSYESVVVLSGRLEFADYPEGWLKPENLDELHVDSETVVIIDRAEIQPSTLELISTGGPRLVAFAVSSIEHEKQVRRMITTFFPWSEVWTIPTTFGKMLVSKDVRGPLYRNVEQLSEVTDG